MKRCAIFRRPLTAGAPSGMMFDEVPCSLASAVTATAAESHEAANRAVMMPSYRHTQGSIRTLAEKCGWVWSGTTYYKAVDKYFGEKCLDQEDNGDVQEIGKAQCCIPHFASS